VIATDVVCVVEGLKHLFFNQMLVVSAVLFGAIKVILFGGLCAHDETWRLEYVSTQLAHCSNVNSSWSWMFVYAFETQILLLLKAWERLFQNVHVLAGSIVACACNFLIAMACEKEEKEEVNMDMGQGFIDTKQELNVDRGTLVCRSLLLLMCC
jgi:hypothetical protein